MNATQALAKVRKLLGKNALIRDNRKPSSPDQRAEAHANRIEAIAMKAHTEKAMNARRDAILAADAEFQRLQGEYRDAYARLQKTSISGYYRYNALLDKGFCYSVEGDGDNLADLVANVEAKKVSA